MRRAIITRRRIDKTFIRPTTTGFNTFNPLVKLFRVFRGCGFYSVKLLDNLNLNAECVFVCRFLYNQGSASALAVFPGFVLRCHFDYLSFGPTRDRLTKGNLKANLPRIAWRELPAVPTIQFSIHFSFGFCACGFSRICIIDCAFCNDETFLAFNARE